MTLTLGWVYVRVLQVHCLYRRPFYSRLWSPLWVFMMDVWNYTWIILSMDNCMPVGWGICPAHTRHWRY